MKFSLKQFKYLMTLSGKKILKKYNGRLYANNGLCIYIEYMVTTTSVVFEKIKVDLKSEVIYCDEVQLISMYRSFFKNNLSEYNSLLMVSLFEILDEGGINIRLDMYEKMIKNYNSLLKKNNQIIPRRLNKNSNLVS
ncbi:hypothetical protein [Succinimonas sp.]|uniref:hypothetical protein n=1 Tax=Succinimonas sp. TaxID=1936151 RepID=UPI00386FABC3